MAALEADCLARQLEAIRNDIMVAGDVTPDIQERVALLGEDAGDDVRQRLAGFVDQAVQDAVKAQIKTLLADLRRTGRMNREQEARLARLKADVSPQTAERLDAAAAQAVAHGTRHRRRFLRRS